MVATHGSWKGLFRFCACIGTMNLKPRIPKGFRLKAQGCRVLASPARTAATLGWRRRTFTTLKGLRPVRAVRRFMESLVSLRACTGTMNLLFHGARLCRIAPCG